MSAIDSTQHKVIGFLKAGYKSIPVYYIVDSQHCSDEFNTGDIYIGGGSGEHPALCVSKDGFQMYVVDYLKTYIHEWIEEGDATLYSLIKTKLDSFSTPDFWYEFSYFDNNEWPVSTWSDMHTYIQGAKLDRHYEADSMLANAVGQFSN